MTTETRIAPKELPRTSRPARQWLPQRVLFTQNALAEPWGQQIYARIQSLGLPLEELPGNRLNGLRGASERETYNRAKRTLAVVTAPPSMLKLQPIPPSADWQFHLATGCPAHCQYCYLAGSLQGPPVVRVFANLPEILANLPRYERPAGLTSFEASCYTDPLGIEHLTGSLAETIRFFGNRPNAHLRWVTKFDAVDQLLELPHNGHTRCRISMNAAPVSGRLEGGTASLPARLAALRKLALPRAAGGGGYPVGVVLAPIMPVEGWEVHYSQLLDSIAEHLDFPCDLTFELITHRFTAPSKETLLEWYPNTSLDMDETTRSVKRTKLGSSKYVFQPPTMKALRAFFERGIAERLPQADVLYWT